jgi:hypothetical protein
MDCPHSLQVNLCGFWTHTAKMGPKPLAYWSKFTSFNALWKTLLLQGKQLSTMLDENPAVMERRAGLAKRLELYKSAQAEIDVVAF